jgi:hypothetical protein
VETARDKISSVAGGRRSNPDSFLGFPFFCLFRDEQVWRDQGARDEEACYWVVRTVRFDVSNCCCRRCGGEARYYLEISEQPGEIWIARTPEDAG